jgi:hypothetical protein
VGREIIASEARLVVRLDTSDAEKKIAELPKDAAQNVPGKPTSPGGHPPGSRPPGRDVAGSGGGTIDSPMQHAKGLAQAAWGGGLYNAVRETGLSTIAAIPLAGGPIVAGLKYGELAAEFGPQGAAAARAFASSVVKDPATRQALDRTLATVEDVARGTAAIRDELKAKLDAFGETIADVKSLSVGAAALGGLDPSAMAKFGADAYTVNKFMSEEEKVRRRRDRVFLGRAVGDAGGAAFDRLFAGRSIR